MIVEGPEVAGQQKHVLSRLVRADPRFFSSHHFHPLFSIIIFHSLHEAEVAGTSAECCSNSAAHRPSSLTRDLCSVRHPCESHKASGV